MTDVEERPYAVDSKQMLKGLEDAERLLTRLIESEQDGTLPNGEELEIRYQRAVADKAKLQGAIDGKKKESEAIKMSITAMKAKCDALTDETAKANRWVAMADEIRPMGEEIIAIEAAISALETQKLMVDQAIVMAEAHWELVKERQSAANDAGGWERKLEEIRAKKEELGRL